MATEVGEPAKAVVEQAGVAEPNGEPPATTAATETAPEKTPEGSAAPNPPAPKPGIASAITAWSTASLTFLKAVLALIVAVVLVVATVRILWRSYGQKQITIEVAPDATKVIAQMGIDFDLRSMLVAAVGQKIEAVQTIVKLQDLVIVDGDQTIDLKAVGRRPEERGPAGGPAEHPGAAPRVSHPAGRHLLRRRVRRHLDAIRCGWFEHRPPRGQPRRRHEGSRLR